MNRPLPLRSRELTQIGLSTNVIADTQVHVDRLTKNSHAPWLRSGTGEPPTPPSADGNVTLALRPMYVLADASISVNTAVSAVPLRITVPISIWGVMYGSTRPVRSTESPT